MGLHGKPRKEYREKLKEATALDYDKLLVAVVEAILSKQRNVYIACSYLTKWPKDFPWKIMVEDRGEVEVYKVNARKVLIWLKEHGHTQHSWETLWKAQVVHAELLAFLDKKEYNDEDDLGS